MTLHLYLNSDVAAFNFTAADVAQLQSILPGRQVVLLPDEQALLAALPDIEYLDTWQFDAGWYAHAPRLQAVFTPAAGKDWVAADPAGKVPVFHGEFHGPMIAETLLGMMLHFNRDMTHMLALQARRQWDRNHQQHSRLLRNQTALIIGYGNIGQACAALLSQLGMQVFAHRRRVESGRDPASGATYIDEGQLDAQLGLADHVILLLPGGDATHGYMNRQRLSRLKPGACLYNFGRGTTLLEADALWALEHCSLHGMGLDVTEQEPLPATSALWAHPRVLLLPHSSCIYADYKRLHISELAQQLGSQGTGSGLAPEA